MVELSSTIHHVPALLRRKSKLLLPRIGMASSRRVHASNFVIPTKYSRLSTRTLWFRHCFHLRQVHRLLFTTKLSPRLPSIRRCSRRPQRIALVPSNLPQPKAKGREGVVRKRARKAMLAPRREDEGKQGRCDGWNKGENETWLETNPVEGMEGSRELVRDRYLFEYRSIGRDGSRGGRRYRWMDREEGVRMGRARGDSS